MENPAPVTKQNLKQISDNIEKQYDNFVLDTINNHCLRMAVMHGDYRWHYHAHTDELFVVLEGELTIEIKDQDTVILQPGDFLKIPAGTIHKTSTTVRTVNLTIEKNEQDTVFLD